MRKGVMASVGGLWGPAQSPCQWGVQPGTSLSMSTFSTAGCRVPRNPRHSLGPAPSRSLQHHAQRCEAEGSSGLVTEKPGRTEVHTVGSCVTARTGGPPDGSLQRSVQWGVRSGATYVTQNTCMQWLHFTGWRSCVWNTSFMGREWTVGVE